MFQSGLNSLYSNSSLREEQVLSSAAAGAMTTSVTVSTPRTSTLPQALPRSGTASEPASYKLVYSIQDVRCIKCC